jgi:hypothetical protein
MLRPSPVPEGFINGLLSSFEKLMKSFSIPSFVMPLPVSIILMEKST